MRRVESLRKEAGLEKKDRIDLIDLFIKADKELKERIHKFEEQIIEKVGAKTLIISGVAPKEKFESQSKEKVKGKQFEISFNKV